MKKFGINMQVPPHLAFMLILILSLMVSWFTVSQGNKISNELKDSQVFDIKKRTNGEAINQ